jgi:hypothetical protein
MRLFRPSYLFRNILKTRTRHQNPTKYSRKHPISVPVCPFPARTSILSKPLYIYVNLCYNNRVVEQFDNDVNQQPINGKGSNHGNVSHQSRNPVVQYSHCRSKGTARVRRLHGAVRGSGAPVPTVRLERLTQPFDLQLHQLVLRRRRRCVQHHLTPVR